MEFELGEEYGEEAEWEKIESGLKVIVGSKEYWNCGLVEGSVCHCGCRLCGLFYLSFPQCHSHFLWPDQDVTISMSAYMRPCSLP